MPAYEKLSLGGDGTGTSCTGTAPPQLLSTAAAAACPTPCIFASLPASGIRKERKGDLSTSLKNTPSPSLETPSIPSFLSLEMMKQHQHQHQHQQLLLLSLMFLVAAVTAAAVAADPQPQPEQAQQPQMRARMRMRMSSRARSLSLLQPPKPDCPSTCSVRCSNNWMNEMCNKMCNVCCNKCSCVPPGTGQDTRHLCPCYDTMVNPHTGKLKCP